MDAALLLVGCGKMGGALLGGWLDRGVAPERVRIVEPAAGIGSVSYGFFRNVDSLAIGLFFFC